MTMPDTALPDHPDPTPASYTRYLDRLQHLERLLYRHRRYRLLGTTLLTACAGLGAVAHWQGAPLYQSLLATTGIALSAGLMATRNARPSRNHLKLVLLISRLSPPGVPSSLSAEPALAAMGHGRPFMRLIADWIDVERQRCMMARHHQEWDLRYSR